MILRKCMELEMPEYIQATKGINYASKNIDLTV